MKYERILGDMMILVGEYEGFWVGIRRDSDLNEWGLRGILIGQIELCVPGGWLGYS